MRPFIGDAFTDDEFAQLIARAYAGFGHAARAPLKQLRRTISCWSCSTGRRWPSRTSPCS
jgi:hypothetical protein